MTSPRTLRIDAIVAGNERSALVAASEQLGESLGAATGQPWHIDLHFRGDLMAVDVLVPPSIVVASLLPELARGDEPLAAIEARWRAGLATLVRDPGPAVLLCTIFRHVAAAPGDARTRMIERIRRLDRMAIDLSHDAGVGIADVDRTFAHLGARYLATDYRMIGALAAEVAAWTLVTAMLARGLDDVIAPDVQEAALRYQGPLWEIDRLLRRRLPRAA
jgi:hypothetical protein